MERLDRAPKIRLFFLARCAKNSTFYLSRAFRYLEFGASAFFHRVSIKAASTKKFHFYSSVSNFLTWSLDCKDKSNTAYIIEK